MITNKEIRERIKVMAESIHEDYGRKERPVMVCVLKGANPFFQNLLEALQDLKHGYTMEFLRASSYEGNASTGKVKVENFNFENLEGKHVIIVEDIVDTGTTLSHSLPLFKEKGNRKSFEIFIHKQLYLSFTKQENSKNCYCKVIQKFNQDQYLCFIEPREEYTCQRNKWKRTTSSKCIFVLQNVFLL